MLERVQTSGIVEKNVQDTSARYKTYFEVVVRKKLKLARQLLTSYQLHAENSALSSVSYCNFQNSTAGFWILKITTHCKTMIEWGFITSQRRISDPDGMIPYKLVMLCWR